MKLVRFEVDPTELPPLTKEQAAELDALRARGEDEIDMSDIPPLPDDFWTRAVRGRFG